ncbi:MAG: PD-(D/E)XK nuclease family protein [Lachnospiraceae bacterium]|nr:PD-(D/E)XK nuclease family protein [Lachnospiraceae bacterium]
MGKLHIITGEPGTGKSSWIIEDIKNKRKSADQSFKRIFVIVPETYSHSTEKSLIEAGSDGISNTGLLFTEVLSFSRLSYRLLGELGHDQEEVLDNLSKNMLVRYIIRDNLKSLGYFKNNAMIRGYINEISEFITELKNYGISPDKLDEVILECKNSANAKGTLIARLSDLSILYRSFEEYLQKSNLRLSNTGLETVYKLLDMEGVESKLLNGADIYIDGFSGFMYHQFEMITRLLERCDNVYITFTMQEGWKFNKSSRIQDIFSTSRDTLQRIIKCAQDADCEDILQINLKKSNISSISDYDIKDDLLFFNENIFRKKKLKYDKKTENIFINEFNTFMDEIDYVVNKIKYLMLDPQNHYNDFAVLTGSLEDYKRIAEAGFNRGNIPAYIDSRTDISDNPAFKFVVELLYCVELDFDYNSVMTIIKSGFLDDLDGVNHKSKDILDNFLLATDIRGKSMWEKEWDCDKILFDMVTNKLSDKKATKSQYEIPLNTIRKTFLHYISSFYNQVKGKNLTIADFSDILAGFLVSMGLEKKILNLADTFNKSGNEKRYREYTQVFEYIMNVLRVMKNILGREVVTFKEFINILEAGTDAVSIGTIPKKDGVIIGDIAKSQIGDVKYLFVVGMNDSCIPGNVHGSGFITDEERGYLTELPLKDNTNICLAPNALQKIKENEFKMFLNLTKAREKLTFSFCKYIGEDETKEDKPAYVIKRIKNIFPNILVENRNEFRKQEPKDIDDIVEIIGADYGLSMLISGLRNIREGNDYSNGYTFDAVKECQSGEDIEYFGESMLFSKSIERLDRDLIKNLYSVTDEEGNIIPKNVSISQLEKFASCPYMYFLRYGLGLTERKLHEVNFIMIGNIMHDAMDGLVKLMKNSDTDFADYFDNMDDFYDKANKSFDSSIKIYEEIGIFRDKKNIHMVERFREAFLVNARQLVIQMKKGHYRTYESELKYSLSEPMKISGFIDKVDIAEGEGIITTPEGKKTIPCTYVRVNDYKTGAHKAKLSDLYYGIQLQMYVYLEGAKNELKRAEKNKIVIPAGVFYVNLQDKIEDNNTTADFRPDGIYDGSVDSVMNLDSTVVQILNKDDGTIQKSFFNNVTSDVIQFNTDKNGVPKRATYEHAIEQKDMDSILKFTLNKINELKNDRDDGNISICPYRKRNSNNNVESQACSYCVFSSVCYFDKNEGRYKEIKNRTNTEIIEKIKAEEEK